jgi:aspartate aminotransferase
MPKVSERALTSYDTPIRNHAKLANMAEAQGKKIYYLNIGQPDICTPPEAMNALKKIEGSILAYSPSEGHPTLREKYAEYYRNHGLYINKNQILVTTGASEAILFVLQGCLDRGQEIIIPEPFYAIYRGYTQMAGLEIKAVTSHIGNGFALPEISAFEKCITPSTGAVLLCNPNNPTGSIYSEKALKELAILVQKHNLFLIVDEVYSTFCYQDEPFFSALSLEGLNDHVVVLDSISKRYSACGARIGCLISRNEHLLMNIRKFAEYRLSPPGLGQIIAGKLLELDEDYYEGIHREFAGRRSLVVERLKKMNGTIAYWPGGAFYVFAELPVDDTELFCRWLLTDFEHQGATLMLAPGAGFYSTPGLGTKEVRIAYVLNEQSLDTAMDCLEEALKQYRKMKFMDKENLVPDSGS